MPSNQALVGNLTSRRVKQRLLAWPAGLLHATNRFAEALCAAKSKQMASVDEPSATDEKVDSLQDLPPHVLVCPYCVVAFVVCGVFEQPVSGPHP